MTVPIPTQMTVLSDWTDQVVYDLDSYGNIGKLVGDDWQQWGVQLLSNTGLGSFNLPNPYYFDDWLPWAQRVTEALT